MRLDVDSYLARGFNLRTSNCWHMTRDAWRDLTGLDPGDLTPASLTARALASAFENGTPLFERLASPADPCIVLMRRRGAVPHVGVYHQGRVLQIGIKGASFLPLAQACLGFNDLEFYR